MSVNKVILIGNVGKDPEIRYFENDRAVANFTIATTERGFTTAAGQQIQERTEWHNLVVWGGLAKVVESYVKKGTQIYIEGKLRSRSWDDKDGIKRYTTEVNVDNLQLLGRKSDNPSASTQTTQTAQNANTYQQPTVSQPPQANTTQTTPPQPTFGDTDDTDDLPF